MSHVIVTRFTCDGCGVPLEMKGAYSDSYIPKGWRRFDIVAPTGDFNYSWRTCPGCFKEIDRAMASIPPFQGPEA